MLTCEVAHSKLFKRCMKNLSRGAIDAGCCCLRDGRQLFCCTTSLLYKQVSSKKSKGVQLRCCCASDYNQWHALLQNLLLTHISQSYATPCVPRIMTVKNYGVSQMIDTRSFCRKELRHPIWNEKQKLQIVQIASKLLLAKQQPFK